MKLITFYADCELPEKPKKNQDGFDWRGAIKLLEASGKRFGYKTVVVTDCATEVDNAWIRTGDCKAEGLMMWLLRSQAEAIQMSKKGEEIVLISPDTLLHRDLGFMFGPWDISILTRRKPKPIVNSVIACKASTELANLWFDIVEQAKTLSKESKEWGADIDAVVNRLNIKPLEDRVRIEGNLSIRFMPITNRFESIKPNNPVAPLRAPIWDFKGARKARMAEYAKVLQC